MLPRLQIGGPDVLVISSLAKAFGVPVAVMSGSRAAVKDFVLNSETRVHCSPPSVAVLRAAEHALAVNREYGDVLRSRLASLGARFRQRMGEAGFYFSGGLFPVQTLRLLAGVDLVRLYERLLQQGIRTVLRQARKGRVPRLSLLITARHTPREIERTVDKFVEALGRNPAAATLE